MEILLPSDISSSFVQHIQAEREHVRPVHPLIRRKHAKDWCVDRYHTESEEPGDLKPALAGAIVAGAGVRRALDSVPGLERPYIFMQEVVQKAKGPITVVYQTHEHCGEIMTTFGAVTPEEQAEIRQAGLQVWLADLKRMKTTAPADAKRIELQQAHGARGSAPTIRYAENGNRGKIEIANSDYLITIIQVHRLNSSFIERLIPEHQNLIRR